MWIWKEKHGSALGRVWSLLNVFLLGGFGRYLGNGERDF